MPKEVFRQEVAQRLKEARRQRALTQRQLADLGQSTQQNISRYEKGFIPDSWFLLARLHAEKAIDLNWLLATPSAAALQPREPNGRGVAGVAADAAAGESEDVAPPAARAATNEPRDEPVLAALPAGVGAPLELAARGPGASGEGRL